jgi:hypothetical protein
MNGEKSTISARQFLPAVVAAVMLVLLAGFGRLEVVSTGRAEFMTRARAAVDALPTTVEYRDERAKPARVERWEGRRLPLGDAERELLRPNAERTIAYTNDVFKTKRGPVAVRDVYYTVIQSEGASYMTGHAPVNCYPGNNYEILKQHDRVWRLGEMDVRGTQYAFRRTDVDGKTRVKHVRNFFIFPDGHFASALSDLESTAADYRKVRYGVTQVQLVIVVEAHDRGGQFLTDDEQDEIFTQLVGSERSLDMIRTLRTGIPK